MSDYLLPAPDDNTPDPTQGAHSAFAEAYPGIPLGFDIHHGITRHTHALLLFDPKTLDAPLAGLHAATGGDEEAVANAHNARATATHLARGYNTHAITLEGALEHRERQKREGLPHLHEQIAKAQAEMATSESTVNGLTASFIKACSQAKIHCAVATPEAFWGAVRKEATKGAPIAPEVPVPEARYASLWWTIVGYVLNALFGALVGIALEVTLHVVRVSELKTHLVTPINEGFMGLGMFLLTVVGMLWERVARNNHDGHGKNAAALMGIATFLSVVIMGTEMYAVWQYNTAREAIMHLANPQAMAIPMWAYLIIGPVGLFSAVYHYYVEAWRTEENVMIQKAIGQNARASREEKAACEKYVDNRPEARHALTILEQIQDYVTKRIPAIKQTLADLYEDLKLLSAGGQLTPEEDEQVRAMRTKAEHAVEAAQAAVRVS